ncbi:NeuD/PglB/VioB family sugar acetyltransferase [Sphingopyxis sp.]|jgi:sugar O-acyltransferase (sialic acid O-acetyltransferase NeuD family)|uniref:NeuD/PglB/VioB family sugar acetyltransferase n=1 Tax=Sphingopyxis sp. TaxID=1908224 RepID=UPI003F717EF8
MSLVIVAGASGQHAAVVYEAAILSGVIVAGFATIDAADPVPIFDCPWLGRLDQIAASKIALGSRFIVACGSNKLRRRTVEALESQGASLQSVQHPAAIVSPSARVGLGSAVLAGAILGPLSVVGRGAIINHAASVDHNCTVGDFCNISPGACLGGCVRVEPDVFVGLNASILPGVRVGQNAVIGAGAVVAADVAAAVTVVGVPARPVKQRDA